MGVLLGKKHKPITDLPTLFFSSPLRQYNLKKLGLINLHVHGQMAYMYVWIQ